MIYSLTFQYHGKAYTNSEIVPGKYMNNQLEAVACALLLGEIEARGFSREEVYTELCLRELGKENGVEVNNVVWASRSYRPTSTEVK